MLNSRFAGKWLAIVGCIVGLLVVNQRVLANDHNIYIPSDTPFYMGTGQGLPVDLMLTLAPPANFPVSDDVDGEQQEVIDKMAETLTNLDKVLPEWGLGDTLHFSAYAVGVYPVLRVQLDSTEKFNAALTKLESERALSPQLVERTGFTVKVFGRQSFPTETDGDAAAAADSGNDSSTTGAGEKPPMQPGLMVATNKQDLIIAIISDSGDNNLLDRVLGIDKPESAMIESARLEGIRKRWGYGDQLAAFLDMAVLADILTSDQSDAGKDLHALSLESPELQSRLQMMRSEPCRAEVSAISRNWPMLVSGLREFAYHDGELRYTSHVASEIGHEQFKQTLQLLRGVIPASQSAAKALFSLGLGLSVDNLTQFIGQMSNLLRAMSFECPVLSGLNRLSNTDLSAASMGVVMFGGLARGVEGVSMNIFNVDLSDEDLSRPVNGADLALVVNAKDPQVLVQTLQMMPQLGLLADLPLDGTEVSLNSMLPLPVPEGVDLKAAIKDRNIVIFAGEKSTEYVGRLANNNSPGLFRTQIDTSSLIDKFASAMQMFGQDSDRLNETVDYLKEYPRGYINYTLDFTDLGVELLSSGVLQRAEPAE